MGSPQPEWFYSSLAQASAAVVGLIGAVLGTRILDHLATMRVERRGIDSRIDAAHRSIRDRIDWFPGFREYLERGIDQDRLAMQQGAVRRNEFREAYWGGGSRSSGSPWYVDVNDGILAQKIASLALIDQLTRLYALPTGLIQETEIRAYATRLRNASKACPDFGELGRPAAMLESDARNLEALADATTHFRALLIPRSFIAVFVALGWLALTGIVWPLLALPGRGGFYSKSWMIGALAVGLVVLIGYFAYQLRELGKMGNLHWHS